MVSLRYEGVSFRYSKTSPWIIQGLNLEIKDGEFLSVVGSSGCGKSTFLRITAGLEKNESGKIYFGSEDVTGLSAQNRDVSIVFQSPCLYPHLDIGSNIAIALKIAGEKNVWKKVEEAAKMCEIEKLLPRLPSEISGGQRQRAAIARDIVRNPKLFLMDEPLSSLDSNLKFQMRMEIKKLQERIGTTTIYVTHDQVEALSMSDKVAVMRMGKIEQMGTPEEVYGSPSNAFVASFMGQPPMNLVEARAENGKVVLGGMEFHSPVAFGKLLVGFRPENAQMEGKGCEITVESVENAGKEFWIRGALRGTASQISVCSKSCPKIGSKLIFSVREEDLRFFDAKGKNVTP